jgi:hypothetical protein
MNPFLARNPRSIRALLAAPALAVPLGLLQGCAQPYSAYAGADAATVILSNGTRAYAGSNIFSDPAACSGPIWVNQALATRQSSYLNPYEEAEVRVQGNKPFSASFWLNQKGSVISTSVANHTLYMTHSTDDAMSCSNALTFTPLAGEKYRARVFAKRVDGGLHCAFEVKRLIPGGGEDDVPDARLRRYVWPSRLVTEARCEDL